MLARILNLAKKLSRPERTQREVRSTRNDRNTRNRIRARCVQIVACEITRIIRAQAFTYGKATASLDV